MKKLLLNFLITCLIIKPIQPTMALELEDEMITTILLEEEFHNGDILEIKIKIEEAAKPILGSSFHLVFENEKLNFLRYEPGNFLERGGDPFYLVTNNDNKIVFGQTLRSEDNFPLGEGSLATFYFQIIEGEEYTFEFSNAVLSTIDVVRQDLDNVFWQNAVISRNAERDIWANSKLEIKTGGNGFGIHLEELKRKYLLFIFPFTMLFGTLLYLKFQEKKRHV